MRYHGGCHECTQDDRVCFGCRFRNANWALPNLNNSEEEKEDQIDYFAGMLNSLVERLDEVDDRQTMEDWLKTIYAYQQVLSDIHAMKEKHWGLEDPIITSTQENIPKDFIEDEEFKV